MTEQLCCESPGVGVFLLLHETLVLTIKTPLLETILTRIPLFSSAQTMILIPLMNLHERLLEFLLTLTSLF